eukprot:1277549-Amphidinium_carterae.1
MDAAPPVIRGWQLPSFLIHLYRKVPVHCWPNCKQQSKQVNPKLVLNSNEEFGVLTDTGTLVPHMKEYVVECRC